MSVTYTREVVDEGPATTTSARNDPYLVVVALCPESRPEFGELAVNEDRLRAGGDVLPSPAPYSRGT